MSTFTRLSNVFNSSEEIVFEDSSKFIFFSDCHRGDGSWADDFARNKVLYMSALNYYYNNNYTYIEIGDGDELWENRRFRNIKIAHDDTFRLLKKFHDNGRFHMLWGNHDIVKSSYKYSRRNLHYCCRNCRKIHEPLFKNIKIHQGLILKHKNTDNKIFIVHGHQGDLLNDRFWPVGMYLVRYLFRPMQLIGIKAPTGPAKNYLVRDTVEDRIIKWVKEKNQMIIAGHTHRPMFSLPGEPPYFNDGCCVHSHSISGIEISNGEISLIKWSTKSNEQGILFAGKDILAGPEKLTNYFNIISGT